MDKLKIVDESVLRDKAKGITSMTGIAAGIRKYSARKKKEETASRPEVSFHVTRSDAGFRVAVSLWHLSPLSQIDSVVNSVKTCKTLAEVLDWMNLVLTSELP